MENTYSLKKNKFTFYPRKKLISIIKPLKPLTPFDKEIENNHLTEESKNSQYNIYSNNIFLNFVNQYKLKEKKEENSNNRKLSLLSIRLPSIPRIKLSNPKNIIPETANTSGKRSFSRNCKSIPLISKSPLDKYILGKEIGKGAYATVRLVVSKFSKEVYAMKIYDKSKLSDKNKKESVNGEINVMKKIDHKNIVKLKEVITTSRQVK